MMGDTEGSVREAERYRQRIPTWAEAKGLVDLPRDPARLEKVRAIYEEALARNPRDAVAITNRGVVRQLTGDPDGAIRDHTEALRILPSLNEAYNNLGVAHLEKGDLKAAAADLERSIQINPLFEVPRVNRGVVRALSGDMTGAIQNFSEVLGYAISRSWAQLNRAAAYEKLAQKEPDRFREFLQGAEADYENVRILMLGDPSHPHAQAAVKGLARVRERLARPKGE
jgi:tetratricopeptide (TPR) repeat protein